jgi:hypothetical protein
METKSLFNFYLEDDVKRCVNEKLTRLNGEQEKGQLAALIRVMLKQFLRMPDENCKSLLEATKMDYYVNLKSNKRSRL